MWIGVWWMGCVPEWDADATAEKGNDDEAAGADGRLAGRRSV